MPKFQIKLEIYGKKMITTVEADNEFRADMAVRQRLHIFSIKLIEEVPPVKEDPVEFLKNLFGI